MRTVAILTNGGDTCALNASIKSIREHSYDVGYKKIYGVRRGYQGLLDGTLTDITHTKLDGRIGGSFLGSMRTSPTKKGPRGYEIDPVHCERMAQTLSNFCVDVLVVIGGDGTLQATQMFQQWIVENRVRNKLREFRLIGFLKTIDNDIRTHTSFKGIEVSLCPGFPSAVQKIVSTIEGLRVTASTAERAFSVEIMGRDAGWLAAAGSYGGAEVVLIPELEKFLERENSGRLTPEELSRRIWSRVADRVAAAYRRNRHVILSVAEGFEPPTDLKDVKDLVEILKNLYGPRKKVGATELVTITLSRVLERYFDYLSELSGHTASKQDLANAIHQISKDEEVVKAKADGSDKHPLADWKIDEKLFADLGIDRDLGRQQPDDHDSSKAQTSERPKKESWSGQISSPPYRFEIRPHRTDYTPRSGRPSSYDYKLATALGKKVGEMLANSQFGAVPCLDKVVPYDQLNMSHVTMVPIDQIRTLHFDRDDYFDPEKLEVKEKVTDFFRTITGGPSDLDQAVADIDRSDLSHTT
jgi:6-phosphofructokinase